MAVGINISTPTEEDPWQRRLTVAESAASRASYGLPPCGWEEGSEDGGLKLREQTDNGCQDGAENRLCLRN